LKLPLIKLLIIGVHSKGAKGEYALIFSRGKKTKRRREYENKFNILP
jgi:hypothetical protein